MAEELDIKNLQMTALTEKLTTLFTKVAKAKANNTDTLLREINGKLKEFQLTYDSCSIELRQATNIPNKVELRTSLREHKGSLKEFKAEYEQYKSKSTKDELLGDYAADAGPDMTSPDSMMQHGLDVQQQSKSSLQRTVGVIAETKEIAVDTIAKLEANTEQIAGMSDKLDEIESTLARSTKIIRRLARKMATDKYIWVFSLLVLGAIIALIAVQQLKGKSVASVAAAARCTVTSGSAADCSSSTGSATTTDYQHAVELYGSTAVNNVEALKRRTQRLFAEVLLNE